MPGYNLEVLNVLVVDDNRHMHSIVKAILNAMRIKNIRFCDDAADAFLEMRQWMPDIIITDWKMEPLDGLDFVRLIRKGQDSPNPYVPIILLTGYTEAERITEARDAGVTEILAKPISIEALHSRIVSIIENPAPSSRPSTISVPTAGADGGRKDTKDPIGATMTRMKSPMTTRLSHGESTKKLASGSQAWGKP